LERVKTRLPLRRVVPTEEEVGAEEVCSRSKDERVEVVEEGRVEAMDAPPKDMVRLGEAMVMEVVRGEPGAEGDSN
jgi:hypothetical protein